MIRAIPANQPVMVCGVVRRSCAWAAETAFAFAAFARFAVRCTGAVGTGFESGAGSGFDSGSMGVRRPSENPFTPNNKTRAANTATSARAPMVGTPTCDSTQKPIIAHTSAISSSESPRSPSVRKPTPCQAAAASATVQASANPIPSPTMKRPRDWPSVISPKPLAAATPAQSSTKIQPRRAAPLLNRKIASHTAPENRVALARAPNKPKVVVVSVSSLCNRSMVSVKPSIRSTQAGW